MPSEKKESANKIYLVAGLAIVFVLTGYFRFFHGKVSLFGQKARDAGPIAVSAVPPIDLTGVRPAVDTGTSVPEPPRTTLRNIFAPLTAVKTPAVVAKSAVATTATVVTGAPPPKALSPPPPLPTLPPPLPSLSLTGTIVGGKKPLAIINGRFVGKGEWIEGLQVISITKNQATLAGGGRSLTLNILEGQIK